MVIYIYIYIDSHPSFSMVTALGPTSIAARLRPAAPGGAATGVAAPAASAQRNHLGGWKLVENNGKMMRTNGKMMKHKGNMIEKLWDVMKHPRKMMKTPGIR